MRIRQGNRFVQGRAGGVPLGQLCGQRGIACRVNGEFVTGWENYVPKDRDVIEFMGGRGLETLGFALLAALASTIVQMILNAIFPKPKQNQPKNEAQRFGIAGLDNTIEEGTPIPVVYGQRRVFPHVIGSRVKTSEDGRHMSFDVLGLVGDTGGDGYEDCTDVEINDIKLTNYKGASFEFRLGADDQTIIPGFENVEQVFQPTNNTIPHQVEIQSLQIKGNPTGGTFTITVPTFGTTTALNYNSTAAQVQTALRAIGGLTSVTVEEQGIAPNRLYSVAFDGVTGNVPKMTVVETLTPQKAIVVVDEIRKGLGGSGSPTVYSTRNPVNEVTLTFQVPGIFTLANEKAYLQIKVEKKRTADPDGSYVQDSIVFWKDYATAQLFKPLTIVVEAGTPAHWDFRFSLVKSTSRGGPPILFNVTETVYTSRNYGGNALLCIRGVASNQIQSLASMRWSALWKGKKVKVWNGASHTLQWTQKRVWIVRDVMTHSRVGVGHRIPESMFDDDAGLTVQNYLDETVNSEVRDQCDVVISEQRPAWNYLVEDLLGEAGLSLIPSGRKLKLIADRPRTPNLLWTYPGNILEDENGPVKTVLSTEGKSVNTLRGTYPSRDRSDKTAVVQYPAPGVLLATEIKPDSYQFDTITRASQVRRQLEYLLKKRAITNRKTFRVGTAAQVVEPGDVDYVRDTKAKNARGFGGRVPAGATQTRIPLDCEVVLESGKTYELIIRRAVNNTTEKRTVITPAGTWGRVDIGGSPFTTAPADGDWWGLGEQNVSILQMMLDSVSAEADGNFRLVYSLYDPNLYVASTPVTVTPPRFIGTVPGAPPIPLMQANVQQNLVANVDGTFSVNLSIDVTPGLMRVGGKADSGTASTIVLSPSSVLTDDYYVGARIKLIAGAGGGQERHITDYDSFTRTATVDSAFTTNPDATTEYEIIFDVFGAYKGFRIEVARDQAQTSFANVGSADGTHFELANEPQGLIEVFRFIPYSVEGVENEQAVLTQIVITSGDLTAPSVPTVALSSYLKTVTIELTKTLPTERDLAGFEVEYYLNAVGGLLLKSSFIPTEGSDNKTGSYVRRHSETFEGRPYGNVIAARVRALDNSNNASEWVTAPSTTTLSAITLPDITAGAINTIVEFNNNALFNATLGAQGQFSSIFTVQITTEGGSVILHARYIHVPEVGQITQAELRRVGGPTLDSINTSHVSLDSDMDLTFMAKDDVPAGTYTYAVGVIPNTGFGGSNYAVIRRRLIAHEVKA